MLLGILLIFRFQVACLVRVPVEVVKQRRQAYQHSSSLSIIRSTYYGEGAIGFYRGYLSTVVREIPFSLIQFPLWEYLKQQWGAKKGQLLDPWEAGICGALAGEHNLLFTFQFSLFTKLRNILL